MPRNDTTLASRVCVALVAEGPTHGWAIARSLAPDGELGRIWSLSRPLTYRTIELAIEHGLLERVGTAPGGGRSRTLLGTTEAGRASTTEWLDAPVALPRDVRTELLMKFALRERVGLPLAPLARHQLDRFAEMSMTSTGVGAAESDDVVVAFRREYLAAVDRFLVSVAESGR